MPTDILDLPGWALIARHLDGHEYELEAEYTVQPTACQKCGVLDRLYRHGTKETVYRDSPIRGHATRIRARVQRYRCRECGETFLQPLAGIQEARRMTERCAEYIKEQCLLDTFVRIALDVGCDDRTVRNLAGEHIAGMDAAYAPELPAWLGIDETQIDGKMRCVLTNIGDRRPIEMLADRDRGTLATWLNTFRDRSMVRGVAIDMWRPYLTVSELLLPGVPVVIDKFHVVRMANYCMERVRIRLQKARKAGVRRDWLRSKALLNMRYAKLTEKQRFNVDMWLDNELELAAAHRLKEAFYDVYDMPKAQAIEAYDAFAASVPATVKGDFKVLLTAMKNWRKQILAYFDHPISNAYTEALNGVAKTINRAGRGYSFEVLRARILFSKRPQPRSEPVMETTKTTLQRNSLHAQRAMLLKRSGGRCESCLGMFEAHQLQVHLAPAVVPGEHRKALMVCANCHKRFHTELVSGHDSASTQ
jgi:transposase